MTDNELKQLLRSALPLAPGAGPSQSLWPLVVKRVQTPTAWSRLDLSLAAVVAIILLMFPGWLLLLAYHL